MSNKFDWICNAGLLLAACWQQWFKLQITKYGGADVSIIVESVSLPLRKILLWSKRQALDILWNLKGESVSVLGCGEKVNIKKNVKRTLKRGSTGVLFCREISFKKLSDFLPGDDSSIRWVHLYLLVSRWFHAVLHELFPTNSISTRALDRWLHGKCAVYSCRA